MIHSSTTVRRILQLSVLSVLFEIPGAPNMNT